MANFIDLSKESSGSDIEVEEIPDVIAVPAPAVVKQKPKPKPAKKAKAETNLTAKKPQSFATKDKTTRASKRKQITLTGKLYLEKDVPWGRIVALKNCKAVVRGRQWDLVERPRKFTQIGRNHQSDVQFLDLTVSGHHLEIHPKISGAGVLESVDVIDKSSNGTWLNGKRMIKGKRTRLKSGDVFSLVQNYRQGGENVAAFVFSSIRNIRGASVKFFQKYRLGKELGRGTYATVRLCFTRAEKKRHAVKIIDLNSGRAQGWEIDELIKNAKNEAQMQIDLSSHPNIIDVQETFVDKEAGTVYIVMDFMEGGELFNQLRKHGHYTERKSKIIMRQILSACAFMNKCCITHRDMKPANILLTKDKGTTVKIADFGVAVRKTKGMSTYTGSPMYFAPEVLKRKLHPQQVIGETYSCSSDMWSVGVIMFNLLCARNPWTASEFEKTLEKSPYDIDKKKPWPKISVEAKDLLRKLWDPNNKTRLKAADALRHPWLVGTKEIIKGESAGQPLTLGNCPDQPSRKRHREAGGAGSGVTNKKKKPNVV